ncbi:hypothetical protein E4U38_001685 [Claviceps purpurea]|nr:hypothetical protein E4U38_001685 [Claviceps purpurea]
MVIIKTASSISFLNQRHIATPSRLESLWDETEAAFSYGFLNIPEQTSRLVLYVLPIPGTSRRCFHPEVGHG